jgi:hypothetical protein
MIYDQIRRWVGQVNRHPEAMQHMACDRPQPAPPDPARGSVEWFALQEKLKNSG